MREEVGEAEILEKLSPVFGPDGNDPILIDFDLVDELCHGLSFFSQVTLLREIGPSESRARRKAAKAAERVLSAKWGDDNFIPIEESERKALEEYVRFHSRPDESLSPPSLPAWEEQLLIMVCHHLLGNPGVRFRKKPARKITKEVVLGIMERIFKTLSGSLGCHFSADTIRKRMGRSFPETWKRLTGLNDVRRRKPDISGVGLLSDKGLR